MTFEIAAVLLILAVSLALFVTEKLRMDLVALLVLATLGVSGMVTLEEALAGFSNPAVVTVWAMFILSAGLSATGVADIIGRRVLAFAGRGEARLILVVMITAGVLSAFMNNIGVAALMLPVVMDVARRTGTSPSRLLMPMAYASLLGGLTTLIGTPPNLVASNSLRQAGFDGFSLFEFAPIGVPALILGTLFVAFIGRHLLPSKMPEGMTSGEPGSALQFSYELEQRKLHLRVSDDSSLHGRSIGESRLAPALGFHVIAIQRGADRLGDIGAATELRAGDILTVQGRVDEFQEFIQWNALEMASGPEIPAVLPFRKIAVMRATIATGAEIVGLTPQECDFQRRFGCHILAVHRGRKTIRGAIPQFSMKSGDALILEGRRNAIESLRERADFDSLELLEPVAVAEFYPEGESLFEFILPNNSRLAGSTLVESGLGETFGLRVIGIGRRSGSIYFPDPDERILAGDQLLVMGRSEGLELMRAIQSLELLDGAEVPAPVAADTISDRAEVTLSPRGSLAGRSLRELDFRQRYGLTVAAIWRGGRAYRSHLRNMRLEFGDALLLTGPPERVDAIATNPEFLLLGTSVHRERRKVPPGQALLATSLMAAVVISVLSGWLPIAVAATAGAALMIVTRCLTMEDAYAAIEWKSVVLIAGMIPLGTAMETTGAAQWIAQGVAAAAGPFGPWGILIGIYLLTAAATTIVPTTALVLIMAPIAIGTSATMGLDPKLLMMGVAMAASASFTSPISHPANVLVMGPGGYRFIDYVKMGLALALVVLVTVLPLIVWRYR